LRRIRNAGLHGGGMKTGGHAGARGQRRGSRWSVGS
jgi:hypothetical protein